MLNRIVLMGRLTRDPELRRTQSGTAVVSFSVACDRDYAVQGAERDVTGMVLAPSFKSALAAQTTTDGAKLYPQLAWGANPGEVNGLRVESTSNLSAVSSLDRALVGDFTNCFKWGYAKEMPIEVIQYGNPDNDADLGDLKGHNQVYLRGEAYIGWGILDPSAFAHIKANA